MKYRIVNDHYFYIICFLLHVLQNHNDAKSKIERLYVNTIESKFRWFCFKLYQFFVFPIASRINADADIPQFYSTITFNDNQSMISKNKTEISEMSTVPASGEKKASEHSLE